MPTRSRNLASDLRFSLRQLRKAPGFTLTAILTLALGIGATTAIFTFVYDVLLRPLPYRNAGRIALIQEKVAEFRDIYPTLPVNANHFVDWQKNAHTAEAMAVVDRASMPMGTDGHPWQSDVLRATPGIFSVLGVSPALGRAFPASVPYHSPDEHTVILMDTLWRTQFQSDPNILGRTITLNGFPYTVIGVMPHNFHLPLMDALGDPTNSHSKAVDAIVPLTFSPEQLAERMGDFNYPGLVLLKTGVSLQQASDEFNALEHAITITLSGDDRGTLSVQLTDFQQALVGDNRKSLLILLAAVAGLLLVGCANITNLLLARAAGRRHQLAIASALGARRSELMRMALSETVLLAAAGGLLGIGFAAALIPLMQRFLPPSLDLRGVLHLDWAGAACALLLAVLSTLLAGAAPAWLATCTQPSEVLHSESRLTTESRGTKRLRRILVASEVAVGTVLILLTGLLVTSLIRMNRADRGFTSEHVLTAHISLPRHSYTDDAPRAAFYDKALDSLRRLPGVEAAGAVSMLPLDGDTWVDSLHVKGDTRPAMQIQAEHLRWTSPGYLETIRLPLIEGRLYTSSDNGKLYIVISQLTARTLWPGRSAIGQQVTGGRDIPFTVIGVVGDARTISLAHPDPMMVYAPYWVRCDTEGGIVIRTHQDPAALSDSIRKTIWSVDPEVSIPAVRALGGLVADSTASRRFEMNLLIVFAISALLLAALGIYGVVAYSVAQRHREIGLRLALGAQRSNIYQLILRDGLAPVLAGSLIGVVCALAVARLARSLLFDVSPYNPALNLAAILILSATGAAASLLPARRAASVNPVQALKSE